MLKNKKRQFTCNSSKPDMKYFVEDMIYKGWHLIFSVTLSLFLSDRSIKSVCHPG